MSFVLDAPVGAQLPTVASVPAAVDSDADDACFFAGAYGLVADPWQRHVLDGWMGVHADGMLAAPRAGLAVPRQNGKNAVIEILELFRMVEQSRRILHTAHEVKTARKAFARLKYFFGDQVRDPNAQFPELNRLVREVRSTNGQEAIVLRNGGSVEFVARSKSSGRGFSVDDLLLDEAQELSEDALAALVPTLSASPNPQRIFTGTPPAPSADGEVFTRIRTNGVSGQDPRLCWHEWSAESAADLDDRAAWAAANPGLGIRLMPETIADERSDMADDTFARERLGLWDAGTESSRVIDSASWAARADVRSVATDRFALAVDTSPDRSVSSVGFAGLRSDGLWHVELDEQRTGTDWVVDYVKQRLASNPIRAVVIDLASPASSLIPDFERERIRVTTTDLRKLARACSSFYDGATQGGLVHIDQPQVNTALAAAGRRDVGDGLWAWSRKSASLDITALVAATLALWGAQADKSSVNRPGSGRGRTVGGRVAMVLG
jgi:phage terminase large subunit-like protein